jgi:hypothetical protein
LCSSPDYDSPVDLFDKTSHGDAAQRALIRTALTSLDPRTVERAS